jgi:hypothetical protein
MTLIFEMADQDLFCVRPTFGHRTRVALRMSGLTQ